MERYCKNDRPYIYVAFPREQEEQILPVLETLAVDGAHLVRGPLRPPRKRALATAFGVLSIRYGGVLRKRTLSAP